ncbi:MAG: hypothetical protein J3T61_08590, partial [Candidatus Brocadiales bacterium]|nr:hypothetical protein [Candidatus Bathyanammoxibius sp.]
AIADVTFDVERGDYRNRFDDCVYYVKRRESKKKIGDTKERIKTLDSDEKMEEAKLLREFHEKTKLAHLSRKRTQ